MFRSIPPVHLLPGVEMPQRPASIPLSPPDQTTLAVNVQPHHPYSYTYSSANMAYAMPSTPTTTSPPNQGTSSAFSSNANPGEDWTKITDLAERRRIQNRIAQRNYRKKLKKRLEESERQAHSSSSLLALREDLELMRNGSRTSANEYRPTRTPASNEAENEPASHHAPGLSGHQRTSPDVPAVSDDRQQMFSSHHTRQMPTTPPPYFIHGYASQEQISAFASYPQHHPHNQMPTTANLGYFPDTALRPISPGNQPAMMGDHHPSGFRADVQYSTDQDPFSANFATMAGMDMAHAPHDFSGDQTDAPGLTDDIEELFIQSSPDSMLNFPYTPCSSDNSP